MMHRVHVHRSAYLADLAEAFQCQFCRYYSLSISRTRASETPIVSGHRSGRSAGAEPSDLGHIPYRGVYNNQEGKYLPVDPAPVGRPWPATNDRVDVLTIRALSSWLSPGWANVHGTGNLQVSLVRTKLVSIDL